MIRAEEVRLPIQMNVVGNAQDQKALIIRNRINTIVQKEKIQNETGVGQETGVDQEIGVDQDQEVQYHLRLIDQNEIAGI